MTEWDQRIGLYQAGYSIEEVADITNYSSSGVREHLVAKGVEMRPPGYHITPKVREERLLRVAEMNGHS